jgi:predicted aminopeptidase
VRSARPHPTAQLGLLAVCCLLLAGALSGCTTTQETAATRQAQSKRFLEEREQKRARHQKADRSRSQKK